MKKTLFLLSMMVAITINSSLAQNKINVLDTAYLQNGPLKGLKLLSISKSKQQETQSEDIDSLHCYNIQGEEISADEFSSKAQKSKEYIPLCYINNKGKIKATVIVKVSEAPQDYQEYFLAHPVLNPDAEKKYLGKQAIPFEAIDINGKKYTADSLKGKVVVMHFWFIGCAPCMKEMPIFNQLVEKYANNKNVIFLSVANDDKEKLKEFLQTHTVKGNIIAEKNQNNIIYKYSIKGYPTNIILNKEFAVTYYDGGLDISDMDIISYDNILNQLSTIIEDALVAKTSNTSK